MRIGNHDLETKLRKVQQFLQDDYKVRITVFFRGREIVHKDRGRELLERIATAMAQAAKVDQPPIARGRSLQMLLVPLGDKRMKRNEDEREKP